MPQNNFAAKIKEMRSLLNILSRRRLTLFGKVTVLKTMVVPKIVHLLSSLPSPILMLKEIDRMFFKFIWDGKPDKIKRKILTKEIERGGIRMIDIKAFNKSLKFSYG